MRTVFYNGCVYTGEMPLAQAFVVQDERFIFAGTDEEALAYSAETKIDLGGAFVIVLELNARHRGTELICTSLQTAESNVIERL